MSMDNEELISTIRMFSKKAVGFHRVYAAIGGGALVGLFLSQSMYWTERTDDPDGWFYKTAIEWEEETAMTVSEQTTARNHLKKLGLLQEVKKGIPCRLFYRIDLERLAQLLRGRSKIQFTKSSKQGSTISQAGFDDLLDKPNESSKLLYTESTQEITHLREEELKLRINSWFNRKTTTPWRPREIRLLRELVVPTPEDDINLMERYYTMPPGRGFRYPLRQDIQTLLNNWSSELDRARRPKAFPDGPQIHPQAQLKALEDTIARHVANPDSVRYNSNHSPAEFEDYRSLKRMRNDLTSQIARTAA